MNRSAPRKSGPLTKLWQHWSVLLLLAVAIPAFADSTSQPLELGKVVKRMYDFKEAGKEMEYALFVPGKYNQKKATPLVVLLHGLGSNPQQVINYKGINDEAAKHGFIVVAPFGYNSGGWYGSQGAGKAFRVGRVPADAPENLGELSEKDVLNVLALIRGEFNIDPRRIYLMGHSMGGGGSFYLGMKYADNWAALAPMAPAIYSSPDALATIKHMPIIVVQGDQDNLVPVSGTRLWVAKMKELKMKYKYIEIAGGNHVQSISQNPEMIAEVFAFLSKQKKKR
jgi:poly(3-hydroxybutyrate) depolymerase